MKLIRLFVITLLLCACSTKSDVPKLIPITLTYSYGNAVSFNIEDLVDTSKWTSNQIEQLKENGKVNTESIQYNADGFIQEGTYIIKIKYGEDLVRSTLIIERNHENEPYFLPLEVERIEVMQDDLDFDFSKIIQAVSPIGANLTYSFDRQYINFSVVDAYPLNVTVSDDQGGKVSQTFDVYIIEKEVEETVEVVSPVNPSTPRPIVKPVSPTQPTNPTPAPVLPQDSSESESTEGVDHNEEEGEN